MTKFLIRMCIALSGCPTCFELRTGCWILSLQIVKILWKFWGLWVFFSKLLASPNESGKLIALSCVGTAVWLAGTAGASTDKQMSIERFWTIVCRDKNYWELIPFAPYACKTSIKKTSFNLCLNFNPFLCVLLRSVFCTFQKVSKLRCTYVRPLYIL